MTTAIMIDDTDPGIKYSGSWTPDKGSLDNLGNFGAPYMSTSHYTKGTGSFSFTFSGTYVGVFGSSVDGKDPSRVCTVDGTTIPNNQIGFSVNLIMHCQVYGLSDGQHTITVTVPNANPSGYWFDYLMYVPSSGVSRTNAATLVLWNDLAMAYGTGWTQTSPGTIATTNGATMTIQFTGRTLTWMGYYLSQFPSAATTATYTIDGGSPKSFDLNGIQSQSTGAELNQRFFTTGMLPAGQHTLKVIYNGNADTTPLSIYNVIVQNGAAAGPSVGGAIGPSHPVNAPNSGDTGSTSGSNTTPTTAASPPSLPTSPAPLSTSVVVIGSGSSAVTVTVSDTNSTATGLPNPGGTGTTGTGTGSSTTTGSTPGSSDKSPSGNVSSSDSNGGGSSSSNSDGASSATGKSHNHTGAIIGAVVGVVGLLLLLLLLFLFLRRRNRKRREGAPVANASHLNVVAEPFTARPTSIPPAMSEFSPSEYSNSSGGMYAPVPTTQFYSDVKRPLPTNSNGASPGLSDPTSMWRSQAGSPLPMHQPSRSISTFSSPATATTDGPESEVIMLHEDSGVRIPMSQTTRPGVTVVEMPPTYSAT